MKGIIKIFPCVSLFPLFRDEHEALGVVIGQLLLQGI